MNIYLVDYKIVGEERSASGSQRIASQKPEWAGEEVAYQKSYGLDGSEKVEIEKVTLLQENVAE